MVDTNILIYLSEGDETLADILSGNDLYTSFITEIELFSKADDNYKAQLRLLLNNITIIHSNEVISEKAVEYRIKYKLKTPDAIVAATAAYLSIPIITADKDFEKIKDLIIFRYEI